MKAQYVVCTGLVTHSHIHTVQCTELTENDGGNRGNNQRNGRRVELVGKFHLLGGWGGRELVLMKGVPSAGSWGSICREVEDGGS